MHFAMNSIFLASASVLYGFNITKKRDARGREIVPEVDFRGFLRCVAGHEVHTAVLMRACGR